MYTSPHLISITERVRIDGTDISEDDFARLATCVRETAEDLVAGARLTNIPTFFEQVTAIALLAFAEAKVELAILETGLGGRLDATTAANAEIAAITRIDYDHQRYLGDTIEEIAAEKAAIIREDSAVVIGGQWPEALRVILDRCKQVGIESLDREPHLQWTVDLLADGLVKVATDRTVFPGIELGLRGKHQRENAETAINVIRALRYDYGFSVTDENVITGLMTARHPGRLERVGRFLLDGAHNAGGARALCQYLEEFVQRPVTMIFGAMADKDAKALLAILTPKADLLILTRPNNLRARSPQDLLSDVPPDVDLEQVILLEEPLEAIAAAVERTATDGIILVTGSLYLVGEVRRMLTANFSDKLKTEK